MQFLMASKKIPAWFFVNFPFLKNEHNSYSYLDFIENYFIILIQLDPKILIFFYLFYTAKIFLFYVVLYAFLAAFFAAMLLVFFQTLDLYQPRWQNANGLIGTNPGRYLITGSWLYQKLIPSGLH